MKFALITEGPSEHRIIKHILLKYFRDIEIEINQIQPKIVSGKQVSVGGWNEVLKYCERDEINDILIENDYIVVQIDTDRSQTKPFNISHNKPNNETKSTTELYNDVVDKIKNLIKPEILEVHSNRIIFAICIHTIECWLLPIYFTNNHKSDVLNCLSKLNESLKKSNISPITIRNKNNPISIRTYEIILKNWNKKKVIIFSAEYNYGFKKFIESLKILNQNIIETNAQNL